MNLSPLMKFCFLSLCLHVALAVHIVTDGLLDASQRASTIDISAVSVNDSKALAGANPNNQSGKNILKIIKNKSQDKPTAIKVFEDDSDQQSAAADSLAYADADSLAYAAADSGAALGMSVPVDGGLVTEELRPLNLQEINKSIKRTQQAIEKNIEGQIKLKLLVDETGTVKRVIPMNTLGYGLDQIAEEAAWKLRFIAAKIKSKNVALETFYTVKFKITHQ